MPETEVLIFAEDDGSAPLLIWLDGVPRKAQDKCFVRIERLGQMGHELRRPEGDSLRDGIHELRASFRNIHYRLLYFFHGQNVAILSHGMTKEKKVPEADLNRAKRRKKAFEADPAAHTYEEEE